MSQVINETDDILKDLGLNVDLQAEKLSVIFDVDFVDTDFLEVDFGSTLKLENVQQQPEIKLPTIKNSQYFTMAMVDPDAPNRENPKAKVMQKKGVYDYEWHYFETFHIHTYQCFYFASYFHHRNGYTGL